MCIRDRLGEHSYNFNLCAGVDVVYLVNPNNPTGKLLEVDKIEELVKKMSRINGDTGYVFYSPRGKNPFINESTINDHLKNLGYGGKQTAHGIRLSFNTHLVDQFNQYGNERIIEMCLAHTIKGLSDVEFHYNKAKYWKQRVKLMKLWNKGIVKHGLKI